ncbi:SDR family NAD(P)-dependent oxidoreductase [Actibacterium sp. D379-3]
MTEERAVKNANFVFFGGSTGIGRATAQNLARRGANILIVGRGRDAGEAAAAAMRQAGATSAEFLAGDLSTVAGVGAVADGVRAWKPELHGIMHTAMTAFNGKQMTPDGLEFAFALQYFARAALNRLLADQLAASGDGRIVHIAGNVGDFIKVDLDDLQFEHRKWSFFKSVLGTHVLGFLHIQEAAKLWQDRPLTIAAACVGATKTKSMSDPAMPFIMKAMGWFGTRPEVSAVNAIRLLTDADVRHANGAALRSPKKYKPEPLAMDPAKAARLWSITTTIAQDHGLSLP